MSAPRCSCLAAVLALLGCPRGELATPDQGETPAETAEADSEGVAQCRAPRRFEDYEWVPDDAHMTLSLLRSTAELAPAMELLAQRSATAEPALPVYANLEFRNLAMQLTNLERILAELDQDPAELVELRSQAGAMVWTWTTDCPRERLAALALEHFGVMLRADIERPGVRVGAGSVERFPFDLLTLGEHRVALTLLGQGQRVGAWLHDAERGGDQGPGRALADLAEAPIRAVLDGEALLDPNAQGPAARRLTILVTASELSATPALQLQPRGAP